MRNDLQLTPWTVSCSGNGWADDFYESIFFLGNGRMGIRGYCSSEPENRPIQKGVYLAGIFGEIKPGITDFVNLPTPVFEKIYIDGQEASLVSEISRTLDMYTATLTMQYVVGIRGKTLSVVSTRFLPKEHPALIMQRLSVIPHNDMQIKVISGILTESCNSPIPDDQTKENTETIQLSQLNHYQLNGNKISSEFHIRGTDLTVSQEVELQSNCFDISQITGAGLCCSVDLPAESCAEIEKYSCILTSRDVDPRIGKMSGWNYDALLEEHKSAWKSVWEKCDFTPKGFDAELQSGLRFSMFNLMGSCCTKDPTVSIGARGLSHGRYKGCYFWDTDMFMLPFFLKNDLEASRSLCEYRVKSLGAAKEHSKKMNTAGARYPWMAALDGSEQCETWDIGCSELHITADVAYAIDAYCKASGDQEFYLDHAAEVFIETGRFWISRYTYRLESNTADLIFCKGPDEYCGITNNNLFTNVMVQHNLDLAVQAAKEIKLYRPELYSRLNLSDAEIDHMNVVRDAIKWPRDPNTGRLAQDDTLHLLESADIDTIKADDSASYHHVCFDRLQRYRVIKQADVLLIMTRMPELFSVEEKQAAWGDFEPICLHDSTLSFASHALFALQNGFNEKGYEYLRKALLLDLRDVMKNTGHEGLHLACMGEAWQAARYY